MLIPIFVFSLSFLLSFFLTRIVAKLTRRFGIVGTDIHKPNKPTVPEMGGLAVVLSLIAINTLTPFLFRYNITPFLTFVIAVGIAAIIGLLDDLRGLNALVKPLLLTLAALPFILFQTYTPRPELPFIGSVRLTIVYPLLIPIAMTISANIVNMSDVMNGVMTGTSLLILGTLLISSLILGRGPETILLTLSTIGSLLAFYYYNRYPAKVFAGDIGSLSIGVAIASIAILGRLEIIAVICMSPLLMNAFYNIVSIGRFFERKEIEARPIVVASNGLLYASTNPKAPITLTRVILSHFKGGLTEREVIGIFFKLTLFACFLAFATLILMVTI